jgi:hypothetical protein
MAIKQQCPAAALSVAAISRSNPTTRSNSYNFAGAADQYGMREAAAAAIEPTRRERLGVQAFSIENQLIPMDLGRKGEPS